MRNTSWMLVSKMFIMFLCLVYVQSIFALDIRRIEKVANSFGVDSSFFPHQKYALMQDNVEYFINNYERAKDIIPIIKNIIKEFELPEEFLFVAMVESEFITDAISSKKASGIWQIIPATAKFMGLEINNYIDERQDIIKSTRAALSYLNYLYDRTGKWYLAIMAYNCGYTRLQKAIDELDGDDSLLALIDEENAALPPETRNYIRKIVAMSLIFNDAELFRRYGMEHLLNRSANESIINVSIKGGTPLSLIAKNAKIPLETLKKYNRHLKKSVLPPTGKQYNIYMPYEYLVNLRMSAGESEIEGMELAYKR